MTEPAEPFKFAELFPLRNQIDEMAPLEPYRARDGTELSFRRYPCAASSRHAILIHGSSAHSAYLHAFAKHFSSSGIATVYLPDLRGHGPNPVRRGDIDHVDQLEEDLADLIGHIKSQSGSDARFIVGGHSSGGGLALRFGGSRHGELASGLLLLAPYLGHKAPMSRRGAGGGATPSIGKIVGISLLNGLGVKRYDGTKVLRFNLPEKYHNGYETLEYSFRLMNGLHPDDYRKSLEKAASPLLIIVGTADEAFHTAAFESGILPHKPDARVVFLNDGLHLGIIVSEAAMKVASQWIVESC